MNRPVAPGPSWAAKPQLARLGDLHRRGSDARPSAWELACHALPITAFAAQSLFALFVSARYRPPQTVPSGTQRARPGISGWICRPSELSARCRGALDSIRAHGSGGCWPECVPANPGYLFFFVTTTIPIPAARTAGCASSCGCQSSSQLSGSHCHRPERGSSLSGPVNTTFGRLRITYLKRVTASSGVIGSRADKSRSVMTFQCGARPADRVICGSAPAVTSIFRQTSAAMATASSALSASMARRSFTFQP